MIRVAVLLLATAVAINATPLLGDTNHLAQWNEFKTTYGKSYATYQEEAVRLNIFVGNLRVVEQHNKEFKAGKYSFELGINKFADLTNQEFVARVNGLRRPSNATSAATAVHPASRTTTARPSPTTATPLPDSVDWRTEGYVTPVKDQGQCGSCWAFSATGGLEGQHMKKTGDLVSLSEQNLVDCSWKEGDFGCGGGWMDNAFTYIKKNGGIDTEDSYPYKAQNGKCKYDPDNVGATDTGYTDITKGDENDLTSATANVGPISVAIDASGVKFQLYKSGVYYNPHCSSVILDHGVLVVGYGATDDGTKYYIVKNSWGADWGDEGYLLMSRDRNNNCGIATKASYPIV